MQAVVKMPHIEISVKGAEIPPSLIDVLKKEYGRELKLVKDDDNDLENVFETDWYKGVKKNMTPGKYLRIYRENKGLTQTALGELLGGVPKQNVSNMEHGRRSIGLKMAKQLAKILDTPVDRFI